MATTTIVIKSGTKWFVPADCKVATVEAVGAGSTGSGGSYAKSTNVSFTPGTYVDISIGGAASGAPTWLNTTSNIQYSPVSVVWSGSIFVGWDDTSKNIITSSDYITWTKRTGAQIAAANTIYTAVVAANGSTIVVGARNNITNSPPFKLVYSTDSGVTWNLITGGPTTGYFQPEYIYFINGTFVMCTWNGQFGAAGTYTQWTSTDGISWTQTVSNPDTGTPTFIHDAAYGYNRIPIASYAYSGSQYAVVGSTGVSGGSTYGIGYSATPGGAQTFTTPPSSSITASIAYGNGIWVYAYPGGGGVSGKIYTTSSLGNAWTLRSYDATGFGFSNCIFDGTKFIISELYITGYAPPNKYLRILTSTDGINWSTSYSAAPYINYNRDAIPLVIINAGSVLYTWSSYPGQGTISRSSDHGATWEPLLSGYGAPVSPTKGVVATGGNATGGANSTTSTSDVNSVYTSASGNFFFGGAVGSGDICCNINFTWGGSGGSAGPNGNGGNGGDGGIYSTDGNGGGGGANGGSNGASNPSSSSQGAAGGDGRLGNTISPGGAGGAAGTGNAGSAGSNGGGGGGGSYFGTGGAGSLDIISQWKDFALNNYGVGGGGGGANGGTNGAAGGTGGGGSGTLGQGLIIITYTPTVTAPATYTQAFTSTQDVYIPAGTTSLTVYAIGPGSNGGIYVSGAQGGGGAGAFANSNTIYTSTTTGTAAYANVPGPLTYGSTADTWFRFSGNTAPGSSSLGVLAKGASGNIAGSSASSIGVITFSGGNGGASYSIAANRQRGGGGGGAGSPYGIGKAGGAASTSGTGTNGGAGGGGGAGGPSSTAGSATSTSTGGQGGTDPTGTIVGGIGGTTTANSTPGTSGSGGGGGGANTSTTLLTVRNGSAGSQNNIAIWTTSDGTTYGPGSGGGGGAVGTSTSLYGNGGKAGGYGAGGGAAAVGGTTAVGTPGTGTGGLIVIVYNVVATAVSQATSNFLMMFF